MQRWLSQVKSQELGQAWTGGSSLGSLAQLRPSGCSFSPYGQPHLKKMSQKYSVHCRYLQWQNDSE
jgi:hypothetical protein